MGAFCVAYHQRNRLSMMASPIFASQGLFTFCMAAQSPVSNPKAWAPSVCHVAIDSDPKANNVVTFCVACRHQVRLSMLASPNFVSQG